MNSLFVIRYSLIVKEIFFCLLSGVLLIFSFPNFNYEFLAWFGFVPLFFALKNKPRGKAFLLAYLTGVIFWLGTIYWLLHVTLAGLILLVLYLSLYYGFFGFFISTIDYRLSTIDQLIIPSIWVLLEYIRSRLLTGFPWALLGDSQYQNLPVIQIADITGVWGVSFLVVMVNAAIYSFLVSGVSFRIRIRRIFVPLLCLAATLCYGYYKIYEPPGTNHEPRIEVSVIQGNIPQELKWEPGARNYILDRYIQLTEKAAGDRPDLIVWPEASSPGVLGEENLIFDEIFSLGQKLKTSLLIGTVARDNGEYFNSALLIDDAGKIAGRYDKLHLVPFGEYIPLKNFLPFLETVVPIGDITAGKEYTIFKIQNPKSKIQNYFAVLICFEDLFPELSRQFVKRGADFLVNITNDAWYKKTSAPYQHLQASVFRAVENRVFLVRAANTGTSGFINPDGKIISLVRDEKGEEIFVDGFNTQKMDISNKSISFYTRYGDVFMLANVVYLVTLVSVIYLLRTKKTSQTRKTNT